MDESGFQLQHKPVAVVARKGSKNVPGRTSASRENISVAVCANASGNVMPLMFVGKGKTKQLSMHIRRMDGWMKI